MKSWLQKVREHGGKIAVRETGGIFNVYLDGELLNILSYWRGSDAVEKMLEDVVPEKRYWGKVKLFNLITHKSLINRAMNLIRNIA